MFPCYTEHISTILSQFKPLFKGVFKTTSFWSLLFVALLLASGGSFFRFWDASQAYDKPIIWSSGGPIEKSELERASFLGDTAYPKSDLAGGNGSAFLAENTAISGVSDPLTNLMPLGDGLKSYKIKKGDTFTNLSTRFNISVDTVKWANPGVRTLIPGKTLVILPVSGILYNVSQNDTLDNIAARYGIDPNLIRAFNPNYQKALDEDGSLVLPYVRPIPSKVSAVPAGADLPDLKSYFALPAIGWNWGELHNYNAVDIANQCGTPVHAAAEGLVVSDQNFGDGSSGWNDGYGTFVLLEHPNGTKTRYTHLDKAEVKIGDYVTRGEEIGLMGNTGNTDGPTGCHLHFEVYGAKNPFAVSK